MLLCQLIPIVSESIAGAIYLYLLLTLFYSLSLFILITRYEHIECISRVFLKLVPLVRAGPSFQDMFKYCYYTNTQHLYQLLRTQTKQKLERISEMERIHRSPLE